ncbi:PstS family phosphate ABC transporter substrate-binding protein [Ureibacillus aquaedulcis]|uniref:Substrate-binding domain-containing protein n=1 Tax=Ureibacillus aquaedulcis TaxID=3058421 RepID=A0ABT8GRB4_9BACL|nr:substrate-binding domain-containing protein [Ureibacillus sp. BA0131]MDN4493784.1 substrate-binding domain-containing protein [Ureibacillus sp. BA0131]
MKNESVFERVFQIIFIFLCLAFVAGIAILYTLLIGKVHYIGLIVVIGLLLLILFAFMKFQLLKNKKGKAIFFAIAFLALGLACIQPVYEGYKSRLATVDSEVDITEYAPFLNNSKVAHLSEPSSLAIKESLPKIDGATALYPLYSAIVQATYPKKEYDIHNSEVIVTTTPSAYTNLFEGKVDMIFAAAPSKSQLNRAKLLGLDLNLNPIGKEAFVFFVNQKNKIDGLSSEQLKGIYSGEVTDWEEVGGEKDAIRAFQRPEDSGSQSALQSFMGEKPIMEAPTEDIASGMGGIISEVAQYKNFKNAIGYTFRFYSTEMVRNNKIKLLEIDGVAPTKDNIRNNRYPITTDFYIVTAGTDNPNVQKLIDWILSPQGQGLVEEAGYVPVKE